MKIEPKEYQYCLRCGRKLKNEQAKKLGYGVVCYKKLQSAVVFKQLFTKKR